MYRHAKHVDDLTQQIEALVAHSARLDNWVNALKGEAKILQDEIDAMMLRAMHARLAQNRRTFVSQSGASVSPPSVLSYSFARAVKPTANQSAGFNARVRRFRGVRNRLGIMGGSNGGLLARQAR